MKIPSCVALVLTALVVAGCSSVAYTNRKQFNFISSSQEDQLGQQAFDDVKSKSKLSQDAEATAMLQRVGTRIAEAAKKPEFKWEFILIDDPKTINAFCLPGGRVAFYTGILPITKDENGLAVVMAHEVAHALAKHGAERMSQQSLVSGAQQIAVQAGLIQSEAMLQVVQMAYGVGVGLPHGRSQESEADHIGLILMAKAGYDPRGAVDFWQRMKAASGGNKPPAFLSTHPSDDKRIDDIRKKLPEALTHYNP